VYSGDVTEKLIARINLFLMKGIVDRYGKPVRAGEYRTNPAAIEGVWFRPVEPELIEERMHYLLAEYNDRIKKNIHPIELASIFHQKFEEIHPFQDGNGRTGREILNYMLEHGGYPPIYILPEHRRQYLAALEQGNQSNYIPLIECIIQRTNAAIWYILSKTHLYNILKSQTFKDIVTNVSDPSVYDNIIEYANRLNTSQQLP
jgi:Fic family protein